MQDLGFARTGSSSEVLQPELFEACSPELKPLAMHAAVPSVAIGLPKAERLLPGHSSLISPTLSTGFGQGVENHFHFQGKSMSRFLPLRWKSFDIDLA